MVILHPFLRRGFDATVGGRSSSSKKPRSSANGSAPPHGVQQAIADQRLDLRISFDFAFGLVFLAALHGFSGFKVILILYINFIIATQMKRNYVPAATWVFNICVLFANELAQGYPYEKVANAIFSAGYATEPDTPYINWGSYLDKYGGLVPRWEVLFNVTVLRLISFNMDHYWSLLRMGGSPLEVCLLFPTQTRSLMAIRRSS